jgi:dephospho-CoA kinase
MKILVLTGGIGSGKTTVLKMIKKRYPAIFCICADEIAFGVTTSKGFLQAMGIPDRQVLHERMFLDSKLKNKVEAYVHWRVAVGIIKRAIKAWLCGYTLCVVEIPIWFESHFWRLTRGNNILVVAPLEERIQRVLQRDGLDRARVIYRIKAQMSDEAKQLYADHVIHNNKDRKSLLKELERMISSNEPSYLVHKVILYYGLLLVGVIVLLWAAFGWALGSRAFGRRA